MRHSEHPGEGQFQLLEGQSQHGPGAPPKAVSPFKMIHQMLRGRYLLALLVGVVLGSGLGYAGWMSAEKMWKSEGQVEIRAQVNAVIWKDVVPTDGAAYVASWMARLNSERVVEKAAISEEWMNFVKTREPKPEFPRSSITVTRVGEIATVTVYSNDAEVAKAACVALTKAFDEFYKQENRTSDAKSMVKLDELIAELRGRLQRLQAALYEKKNQSARSDLRAHLEQIEKEEAEIRRSLKEVELKLSVVPESVRILATQPTQTILTIEEIGLRDAWMWQLLNERKQITRQLEDARQNFGPRHRDVLSREKALQRINQDIEEHAVVYRTMKAKGTTLDSELTQPKTPGELKMQEANLLKSLEACQTERRKVSKDMLEIQANEEELASTKREFEVAETQRRQREFELRNAERMQVLSYGGPAGVARDDRKTFASAGAAGGFFMAFAIMLFVGFLDRRLRHPDDAIGGTQNPVLGILPNLPENIADPDQAALAAHCVHQIRTLLQIWAGNGEDRRVFAVTSPVSGTGKTSLSAALGVSFASGAARTLLIDCDMVGGGLTTRINAVVHAKIGHLLKREGYITDWQLEEGVRHSANTKTRLGDALVELGYVSPEELEHVLKMQKKGSVGIIDALGGEDIRDCITATGITNLDMLPLGNANAQHVGRVTPLALRRVIEKAKEYYDTILIDTGPIPGSLEASVVCAEADGVILTVSRGEQRSLAEGCIKHLETIGATLAGIVFNRARHKDITIYGTTYRASQPDRDAENTAAIVASATDMNKVRFGPVATAVATVVPRPVSRPNQARDREGQQPPPPPMAGKDKR